jgi:uncharacterized protein YndB with AHSA1/START domain
MARSTVTMSSEEPRLEEVYKGQDRLVIVADFPNRDPDSLFQFWTDANLITSWWPPSARIDARSGGSYVLEWPKQNWRLRGTFTRFDQGKALGFTWKWDHEPEKLPTEVLLSFEERLGSTKGTRLTLTHGPYSTLESDQRQSHLDGWLFFLKRL